LEFAGWMEDFSNKTNQRNIDINTLDFRNVNGHDQVHFCVRDKKECYVMMRNKEEATEFCNLESISLKGGCQETKKGFVYWREI